jgi:hypothetical protein
VDLGGRRSRYGHHREERDVQQPPRPGYQGRGGCVPSSYAGVGPRTTRYRAPTTRSVCHGDGCDSGHDPRRRSLAFSDGIGDLPCPERRDDRTHENPTRALPDSRMAHCPPIAGRKSQEYEDQETTVRKQTERHLPRLLAAHVRSCRYRRLSSTITRDLLLFTHWRFGCLDRLGDPFRVRDHRAIPRCNGRIDEIGNVPYFIGVLCPR